MSKDNVEKLDRPLTPLQQAEKELKDENDRTAVGALKKKLRERQAAQLVLKNIDKEIADLQEQLADGDLGE